jgi:hypothetical protein
LTCPPELSDNPYNHRHLSGNKQEEWAKGMRIQPYEVFLFTPKSDFFTCHTILWHGASAFTSALKEGMLWIFIALKKSIVSAGFELTNLGSKDKHTNHYTTDTTN